MNKRLVNFLLCFIPFQKWRILAKRRLLCRNIRYTYNNTVVLHRVDGTVVNKPKFVYGLYITFAGKNNKIELFEPYDFSAVEIKCLNNDNVIIKKNVRICGLQVGLYNGSKLTIGQNTEIGTGCHIYMENESDTSVCIGDDCVFSWNVSIFSTDTHPIFDRTGKCINNKKSNVVIGNKCWVCAGVTLLKGAKIGDGCIVGNCSVVTKGFDKNMIIAGNPAKIVSKDEVFWRGGRID